MAVPYPPNLRKPPTQTGNEVLHGIARRTDGRPQTDQFHYWIFFVCILVVFLDGYDGAAMAFAAPAMAAELNMDVKSLGPLFAAALVGMVVGSSLFGLAADRYGRRPAIVLSTLVFGIFTAATMTANHSNCC